MKKILVFGEINLEDNKIEQVTFELISKAKKLVFEANNLKKDEQYFVEVVFVASYLVDDEIKKHIKPASISLY